VDALVSRSLSLDRTASAAAASLERLREAVEQACRSYTQTPRHLLCSVINALAERYLGLDRVSCEVVTDCARVVDSLPSDWRRSDQAVLGAVPHLLWHMARSAGARPRAGRSAPVAAAAAYHRYVLLRRSTFESSEALVARGAATLDAATMHALPRHVQESLGLLLWGLDGRDAKCALRVARHLLMNVTGTMLSQLMSTQGTGERTGHELVWSAVRRYSGSGAPPDAFVEACDRLFHLDLGCQRQTRARRTNLLLYSVLHLATTTTTTYHPK